MNKHKQEVEQGQRFEFGANWAKFLELVCEERIALAEQSLKSLLGFDSLKGKTFLDVGSGSGLFSLAARRLGASICSFDFDPQSVACTKELKQRYFPNDSHWNIQEGSVLDKEYLAQLGQFDVVYSWGVLHHTGFMWRALENVIPLVAGEGKLFIAIYNDQGRATKMWLKVKQIYNRLPASLRWCVLLPAFLRLWGPTTIRDLFGGKPFSSWRNYQRGSMRGMNAWSDVVDWVGGYPFEVAKPEEIFDFYTEHNFRLERLKTCAGGHGCNEFAFKKL